MVLKKVPKNYVYLLFLFFFLILVFSVSKTVLGVVYLFIYLFFFLDRPSWRSQYFTTMTSKDKINLTLMVKVNGIDDDKIEN